MATGNRAMVATDSPWASKIGADILRRGGNAIDAATAVSFALAVTRPYSTGLGGGGFLIYREAATGEVVVFDYRETAPNGAGPSMYDKAVKSGKYKAPPSRFAHLAVGVPGMVAGHATIHDRFGSMPWRNLIQPSIALARDGFPVDAHYVECCESVLDHYTRYPHLIESCPYVYRVHLRGGRPRAVGETLTQSALATLLQTVADGGAEAFYRGPIAEAIAEEMRRGGGVITNRDLRNYRVTERRPITVTYRNYELILMPPPSSGGVCLGQTLNILENFDIPRLAISDPALASHLTLEAMKHAFADRARWLGDADVVDVPTEALLNKHYAAQLASRIRLDRPLTDLEQYGSTDLPLPVAEPPDDSGTSHYCIIDAAGNVVVATETINTEFGSLAAVSEYGLILNNEMDDFAARPGAANAYGLIQSHRNAVAPGKRPLSSMSPTIVLKEGRPYLLIGASGGPRIISSVLHVFLNLTDYALPPARAMTARRPHHQWRPDWVYFDAAPTVEMKSALQSRGHRVSDEIKTGIVQAVVVDSSQLMGMSDHRKGGKPDGY
jgi:gamma-glutamyltranspeptidase/glutathione hydrolase